MEEKTTVFYKLSDREKKCSVEALIFSSDEPISSEIIFNLLVAHDSDFPKNLGADESDETSTVESYDPEEEKFDKLTAKYIDELIVEINNELIESGRPYQIVKVAGGWLYATRKEYGELLGRLNKSKSKRRLSQASLEVLAIIAYRQPVTKPEIEQIRGVNSSDVVNSLIDKGLIDITGRKDTLGKPLLYCTTNEFLKVFGLMSIEELPKLRELEEFSSFDFQEPGSFELRLDENPIESDNTDFILKQELLIED